MWLTAADPAAAKDRRFRALCALAAFDPASPRWKNAGKPAAEALLAEKTLLALTWAEALRPVRLSLLPGLQAVFGGREYDDSERMLATGILVDYAADQPRVLADLLMDADEKQFAVIFPKLKTRGEQGMLVLTGEIDRTLPLDSTDDTKEKLARRTGECGGGTLEDGPADEGLAALEAQSRSEGAELSDSSAWARWEPMPRPSSSAWTRSRTRPYAGRCC